MMFPGYRGTSAKILFCPFLLGLFSVHPNTSCVFCLHAGVGLTFLNEAERDQDQAKQAPPPHMQVWIKMGEGWNFILLTSIKMKTSRSCCSFSDFVAIAAMDMNANIQNFVWCHFQPQINVEISCFISHFTDVSFH